jgi:hypothetical protein
MSFPPMECRKCGGINPLVYFAPVYVAGINAITGKREAGQGKASCICIPCAIRAGFADKQGNIREGVKL